MKEYKRNCPKCGIEIIHKYKRNLDDSIKKNRTCGECRAINYRGKKHTEEHKRKIGLKSKGNQYCLGLKRSDETKRKMSEARKGIIFSEEHKKRLSEAACRRIKTTNAKEWTLTLSSGRQILCHGYERFAIPYLLNKGIKEDDLVCGINSVEPIQYCWNNSIHNYIPDMKILSTNTIVEVKSDYTLNYELDKNREKARATVNAGFNYRLIVFDDKGNLISDGIINPS